MIFRNKICSRTFWVLLILAILRPVFSQEDIDIESLFYHREVQLVFCDSTKSKGAADEVFKKYIFEVAMKESFKFTNTSEMTLKYEDTIVLNEVGYIKLLPTDFRLKIKLSDNLNYFQDGYQNDTSTIEICIEDLGKERLISDFLKGNDTLFINVYQSQDHGTNHVNHKFWKSGDKIYNNYEYFYSCSGPIGNGVDTVKIAYLEDLLVLEKELDGINYDYSEMYDISTTQRNPYYYIIEYGNHNKLGVLFRRGEQKLLLESGLFKIR